MHEQWLRYPAICSCKKVTCQISTIRHLGNGSVCLRSTRSKQIRNTFPMFTVEKHNAERGRHTDTQTKTLIENCRWAKNNLQGNLEGLQAAPVSKQVAAGRVCNCLDKIKTRRNATKQLTWVYLRLPIIHSCTSFWVKKLVNERQTFCKTDLALMVHERQHRKAASVAHMKYRYLHVFVCVCIFFFL